MKPTGFVLAEIRIIPIAEAVKWRGDKFDLFAILGLPGCLSRLRCRINCLENTKLR